MKERFFFFISLALPIFFMWHDIYYSPPLIGKISSRCVHLGKYIFRVTESELIKNLCANHIIMNWKRNLLGGTLGLCLLHFTTAEQGAESVCTAVWDLWTCSWDRVALDRTAAVMERLTWFCFGGLSLFSLPLNVVNPERLTSPCPLALLSSSVFQWSFIHQLFVNLFDWYSCENVSLIYVVQNLKVCGCECVWKEPLAILKASTQPGLESDLFLSLCVLQQADCGDVVCRLASSPHFPVLALFPGS